MDTDDPGLELEAIHEQVDGWFDGFVKSPQYQALTESQKDEAPGVVQLFAEYSRSHLGLAPEKWNRGGTIECCLHILPAKVTAERPFFQAIAPVLSAFFTSLAEKGLLPKAGALAKAVAGQGEEIVAASQDQRDWGPAKLLAMSALEAGVDPRDQRGMDRFIAEFNERLLAAMPAQEPAPPPTPLTATPPPAPPAPVRRSEPKIGRNDPCPCGSGKKFKKCCGH